MKLSDHCAALASPSYANFGVSLFIILGILVSYIPQHHRIISRRSSEGLSPYFILLGTISSTCVFSNILVLPTSRADLACCKEISGFECFAGLLGILQIGVIWACFSFILFLFLIFFPRATAFAPPSDLSTRPSYRTAVIITAACVIHAAITFILNSLFINQFPSQLQSWANFLGVAANILASVQYFPQIYTTWKLQTVGSLSIPMMCIQTPGSFLFVGSLGARLGWAGWSTWGLFLVTGILQGILLGMGIWFELRDRGMRKGSVDSGNLSEGLVEDENGDDERNSQSGEQRPLLGNR